VLWLPAVIVPLWLFPGRNGDAVWWMAATIGVSSILGSLGAVAWLTWTKELIPLSYRVRFFGRRNLFNTGLSLTMGMLGAMFLDWTQRRSPDSVLGFLTVFGVAIGCGLVGCWLLNRIPAVSAGDCHQGSIRGLIADPLNDGNFRSLIAFYAIWNLAVHVAQPFFVVYMLDGLQLPFAWVTGLATLSSLLGLGTNNIWSRLCERFGTKPIVLIATFCDVLVPIAWLFVTPQTTWLLLLIHCSGILNAPLAMGPNNILLRLTPAKNSSPYLAIFSAIVGPMTAVAGIVGGLLATMLVDVHWSIGPFEVGSLKTIFLLSAVGRLTSILLLNRVREPDAEPVILVLRAFRRPSLNTTATPQPETPATRAA
jgi:Na+/melibiose symporter-like transporter